VFYQSEERLGKVLAPSAVTDARQTSTLTSYRSSAGHSASELKSVYSFTNNLLWETTRTILGIQKCHQSIDNNEVFNNCLRVKIWLNKLWNVSAIKKSHLCKVSGIKRFSQSSTDIRACEWVCVCVCVCTHRTLHRHLHKQWPEGRKGFLWVWFTVVSWMHET